MMKLVYLISGNILCGVVCWAAFRTLQLIPLLLSFIWPLYSVVVVAGGIEKVDAKTYTPAMPRTSLDQEATGVLAFALVGIMFVIGFAIGCVIWPFATI